MSTFYGSRGPTGATQHGLRGGTGNISGEKIPSGYEKGRISRFTPEMMQLFNSLFGHLAPDSYLGRLAGGDESLFEEIEKPALKQFAGLQGGLSSRFSGMGLGGRHSTGFQNTATQAASDFAEQLQSQRQGMMQQAIRDLFGMSNQLLGQQPYEEFLTPKKKGFLESILPELFGGLGKGLGFGAGKFFGL
jgi:hypothetical protein